MKKWKKRAIELIAGLSLSDKKYPSVIPYLPKKTHICPKEPTYFTRVSPEKNGVSTATLRCMLAELEAEERAEIHSLLVLARGGVICRCSAPGYDGQIPHLSHSMSKTVLGMAIGFLISEGRISLDSLVLPHFPECRVQDKRLRTLTVRHLLSMQSGVKFSEAGVVTETAWTEAFFDAPLAFVPGEGFAYNSMNSYILACIAQRVTGEALVDYLMPRLFTPLHIERPLWQVGPEGVTAGGWGLFLSDESWAKLGLMLCCEGRFEGKQILPADYVREMTAVQAKTPESLGDFDYGLHLWVGRKSKDFLFNGMLGQNVWCDPGRGLVAVISAGNNEIFAQSPALSILRRRLCFPLPSEEHHFLLHRREYERQQHSFFCRRHWIRASAPAGGFLNLLRHRHSRGYDARWDALSGSYIFRQNNNGILPVFVRTMENCFTGGIDSLSFHHRGQRLWMTAVEGGKPLTLEIGLKDFADTVLTFREEVYLVRAMGEVTEDEDGRPVYKIELCFPELPNVRRIKIYESEEGCYKLRFFELPNQELGRAFIDSFPRKNALLNEILERRLGDGYLHRLLKDVFAPTLVAIPAGSENALALLEREEKARAARRRSVSFITGIVSRFFEEAGEPEKKSERRGFLADLFSRFTPAAKRPQKAEQEAAKDAEAAPSIGTAAEAEIANIMHLMQNAAIGKDGEKTLAPAEKEGEKELPSSETEAEEPKAFETAFTAPLKEGEAKAAPAEEAEQAAQDTSENP